MIDGLGDHEWHWVLEFSWRMKHGSGQSAGTLRWILSWTFDNFFYSLLSNAVKFRSAKLNILSHNISRLFEENDQNSIDVPLQHNPQLKPGKH